MKVPWVQNHELGGYCEVAYLYALYTQLCNLREDNVNPVLLLLLSFALNANLTGFYSLSVTET